MRKSLPRFTEKGLGYSIKHATVQEQIAEQEPQQPVSNEPALHTAYINLMGWNCSFHALAQQSRSGESQRVRGIDLGGVNGWCPPSPNGFGEAAFACFATIELGLACQAVACEASEGWWARQGSNL
jgi:hypothetical protein